MLDGGYLVFMLLLQLLGSTLSVIIPGKQATSRTNRTFAIGHNCFLKDGLPFRYVSGSFHYWRQPADYWENTLLTLRAAGLNAVQTYLIWNLHEREPGHFDFTGNLDIRRFFRLAQKHNLVVILRPGPYIDAEVDMGGFPYWLLRINPTMALRTSNAQFLSFVEKWYRKVLPLIRDLTYTNGGPIVMAQIENEYGYVGNDSIYKSFLKNLTSELLGPETVLFTTDGTQPLVLAKGHIPGTLATIDFGPDTNVPNAFNLVERIFNPFGPLVNSEYYGGWFSSWGTPQITVDSGKVVKTLQSMLEMDASVNFYMFFGGTNFGFSAGAYDSGGPDGYQPVTTSYDYDAPISEAGDPTPKFMAIRNLLGKYLPLPGPVPPPRPKSAYGKFNMEFAGDLFDFLSVLAPKNPVRNSQPLSFEVLGQAGGFVLYRTILKQNYVGRATLTVNKLFDRAYVFVEKNYVGALTRTPRKQTTEVSASKGQVLDLLVQNEGRICSGNLNEMRGISGVELDGTNLTDWMMYPLSLPAFPTSHNRAVLRTAHPPRKTSPSNGPGFYTTTFNVTMAQDTFLNMKGWNNGFAFLNGRNLGRYWPTRGPQVTLYVPGVYLANTTLNTLYIFELEQSPCIRAAACTVEFLDHPILNGTVYSKRTGN